MVLGGRPPGRVGNRQRLLFFNTHRRKSEKDGFIFIADNSYKQAEILVVCHII